jgi:hypothetical protein
VISSGHLIGGEADGYALSAGGRAQDPPLPTVTAVVTGGTPATAGDLRLPEGVSCRCPPSGHLADYCNGRGHRSRVYAARLHFVPGRPLRHAIAMDLNRALAGPG